ncbi:hypothetical protein TKK_0005492 [Trichogramma kaykai]
MVIAEHVPFRFEVTHVDAEGQFLRIWAQTDEKLYQSIRALLEPLHNKINYELASIPVASSAAKPRTKCLVKAMNNDFLRARILNFRPDGYILVQFIDFGNITFVPVNNVRLSDASQDIELIFNLPDAATAFVLADVGPIGGSWIDQVVNQIKTILVGNKFDGVYQNVDTRKAIRFELLRQDFSESLVNRQMAVYSPFCKLPPIMTLTNARQLSQTNIMVENSSRSTKNHSFKASLLEIGSIHDVKISHVEDGPSKFSVQLVHHLPQLQAMMKKINSQNHLHLQEPPIAGLVALGVKPRTKEICRVVLNSPGDTTCKVHFVDYGFDAVLSFNDIYQISEEFVTPTVYSIRFSLSGCSDSTLTQDLKDYFAGLVYDQDLRLKVCKGPMTPLIQYCELLVGGENVKNKLMSVFPDLCTVDYPEPKPFEHGQKVTVFVPYIESTLKFYVQYDKDAQLLDEVMSKVDKAAQTAPRIANDQIHAKMPCIALYDLDKVWYRACMLARVDDNKFRVVYVDFGNEEIVHFDNLRVIPSELVKMCPRQAIKCGLNGLLSGPMNREVKTIFEKIALEQRLVLSLVDNSNNTNIVDLFEFDKVTHKITNNIAETIKSHEVTKRHIEKSNQLQYKPLPTKNNRNGNWNREDPQGQSYNRPITEKMYDNKFSKDNENELRADNRFPKAGFNFSKVTQNNRGWAGSVESSNNTRFRNDSQGNNEINRFQSISRDNSSDKISEHSWDNQNRRFPNQNCSNEEIQQGTFPSSNQNLFEKAKYEKVIQQNNFSNGKKSESSHDPDSQLPINDWNTDEDSLPKQKVDRCMTSTPIFKIPSPNITVGAVKNCELIYYTDPSDFYVHLCPDNIELTPISRKIADIYKNAQKHLKVADIIPDTQCVAQYSEDKNWYRAVIKSVSSNTATVHFVDYGNFEAVSFDKLQEIDPEIVKLPAQAVHCKLFCPCKSTWSPEESDALVGAIENKNLEAEFISEDNGHYLVLLKENKTEKVVNELFSGSADLIKEKNILRNKNSGLTVLGEKITPSFDYAPLEQKWSKIEIDLKQKYDLVYTWYYSPDSIYYQLLEHQENFKSMMGELQSNYPQDQEPYREALKAGDSVIAQNPIDDTFYRATIVTAANKTGNCKVKFVDYGDTADIHLDKIYRAEKKFTSLPEQAIECCLVGIKPATGTSWSSVNLEDLFDGEKLGTVFHYLKNNKYGISLQSDDKDVADILIERGIARHVPESSEISFNLEDKNSVKNTFPTVDYKLLEGQTLLVKISSIESVSKFHIQLYSAEMCQARIDTFMSTVNPGEMSTLLKCEKFIGSGCIVECEGKWKRGVIIDDSKSESIIRFIDTGELESIALHRMMQMPSPLTSMQYQAVECKLLDVPESLDNDESFHGSCLGKTVLIVVEKVKENSLDVRLFDESGVTIKMYENQKCESIMPIASLPITENSHEVTVTWINHSQSIWIQRISDSHLEQRLLDSMYAYYSQLGATSPMMPRPGTLYAGLSSDGNWYRVQVIDVFDQTVTVLLVDYGNIEDIQIEQLRYLDARFHVIHQLGLEVSLKTVLHGKSSAQCKALEPLMLGKQFKVTLHNINRRWIADFVDLEGKKLSEALESYTVTEDEQEENVLPKHTVDEMQPGNVYDIHVSHIDNPGHFWIQRNEELKAIETMQSQLQILSNSCELVTERLEMKSLCLVQHSLDQLWYRAEVIDPHPELKVVRFIDFGMTDAIEGTENRIKKLPNSWKAIAPFAVESKLDVLPFDGEFTDKACTFFRGLVRDKSNVKAIIVSNDHPVIMDVLVDERSCCQCLIEQNEAQRVISPEQHNPAIEEEAEEEEDETPLDSQASFVSFVKSVDEFWLQEDKYSSNLKIMEDRLLTAPFFEKEINPKPGSLVAAHFPLDEQYYRAKVIEETSDGTLVNYIDYGNSGVSKDVRKIPHDIANEISLARKCSLAKPDGVKNWPKDVNEKFEKLANSGSTIFMLHILKEGETSVVKLTMDGRDVSLELIELCEEPVENEIVKELDESEIQSDSILETRPSPIGHDQSGVCAISYLITPSAFYIHDRRIYEDEGIMREKMMHASEFKPVEKIEVGQILAAKYHVDNQWYRGKVSLCNPKCISVFFIDYGNFSKVTKEDLRELPDELKNLPPLAQFCSLKLPNNIDSKSAQEKLKVLANDGNAEFDYKYLSDKPSDQEQPLLITLYTCNHRDVVDLLIESQAKASSNTSIDSAFHSGADQQTVDSELNPIAIGSLSVKEIEHYAIEDQSSSHGDSGTASSSLASIETSIIGNDGPFTSQNSSINAHYSKPNVRLPIIHEKRPISLSV